MTRAEAKREQGGRKAEKRRRRRANKAGDGLAEILADAVATQTRAIVTGFRQDADAAGRALVAAGPDDPTPPLSWLQWWDDLLWAAALDEAEGFIALFVVEELGGFGLQVAVEQPLVQGVAAAAVADLDSWSLELKTRVGQIVDQGFRESASVRDVAANLAEFGDLTVRRATTIARTEMIGASNAASFEGASMFAEPGDRRRWLATRDQRTRDTHRRADGQEVGFDEPFIVGGHQAMHPGDRSLPIEELASCRCSFQWIVD